MDDSAVYDKAINQLYAAHPDWPDEYELSEADMDELNEILWDLAEDSHYNTVIDQMFDEGYQLDDNDEWLAVDTDNDQDGVGDETGAPVVADLPDSPPIPGELSAHNPNAPTSLPPDYEVRPGDPGPIIPEERAANPLVKPDPPELIAAIESAQTVEELKAILREHYKDYPLVQEALKDIEFDKKDVNNDSRISRKEFDDSKQSKKDPGNSLARLYDNLSKFKY